MRYFLALALLLPAAACAAVDDFKVIKLEQDMRNLERQVQTLARQVDELRMQLSRSGEQPLSPRATPPVTDPGIWLDATKWSRIKPGMPELEVVSLLGPPTSLRHENGAKVLLYAMEIGSSGFIGGSISVQDGAVVSVQKPMLR